MTASPARIVVFDPYVDDDWTKRFAAAMAGPDIEFVVPTSVEQADQEIRTADVVIATGRRQVTRDVIAELGRAVGILCLSVGQDQVDHDAASEAGIIVTNVPDYCSTDVADHALALLLAAQRRLFPIVAATKAGMWNQYHTAEVSALRRLGSQTLGIIGLGRIGRLVSTRALACGFDVIVHDPGEVSAGNLPVVDLTTLARLSDAIVVCASLNSESHHLLDKSFFATVRPGLVLVNVARGGLIDERALAQALDDGTVAVAALDVRECEPPDMSDDLLSQRANVIVTPHLGGTSMEAFDDLLIQAAERSRNLLIETGRLLVTTGGQ